MNDKNGKPISKGDDVVVDDPKPTDYHRHAFQGNVIELNEEEGSVVVADQEDDCFEVDAGSLEIE